VRRDSVSKRIESEPPRLASTALTDSRPAAWPMLHWRTRKSGEDWEEAAALRCIDAAGTRL